MDSLSRQLSLDLLSKKLSMGISEDERALRDLAAECRGLCTEILNLVGTFTTKGAGSSRLIDSLRASRRKIWKKDDMEDKLNRLDRIKIQINTHMLSVVLASGEKTAARNENLHVEQGRQIRQETDHVIALLQQHRDEAAAFQAARDGQHEQYIQWHKRSTDEIVAQVKALEQHGREREKNERFLESLWFSELPNRQLNVNPAYEDTFRWIFDDGSLNNHKVNFMKWLRAESADNLFWIMGKAGSGKSTLMKYLHDHPSTRGALKFWAGDKQLIVARFFFWNSGSTLQKSQEGLLRSLLYEILRQCPQLISQLFPKWWADEEPSPHLVWEVSELSRVLHDIVGKHEASLRAKFCFFVDGLDEFEGRPFQLVQDLKGLAKSPCVKLCVSSRPWNDFMPEYKGRQEYAFKLEDHTRGDIHAFICGMLDTQDRFQELDSDTRERIIEDIQNKAQGVFLWVFLVVNSLIHGLDQGDDTEYLEERIQNLPSDLEGYFQRMLESIDETYRVEAATALLLITRKSPLPLIMFWYLRKSTQDPGYALRVRPSEFGPAEQTKALDMSHTLLKNWCRDLLEVSAPVVPEWVSLNDRRKLEDFLNQWDPNVGFAHRTVKDFLRTPQVADQCLKTIAADLDLRFLQLHLVRLKFLMGVQAPHWSLFDAAGDVMITAREFEPERQQLTFSILDQIGAFKLVPGMDTRWYERDGIKCSFMAYAVSFGLTSYVRNALREKPETTRTPRNRKPLLDYVLHNHVRGRQLYGGPPNLEMLKLLLDNGMDPFEASGGPCDPDSPPPEETKGTLVQSVHSESTPWNRFMANCALSLLPEWDRHRSPDGCSWSWPAVVLLLSHGGVPDLDESLHFPIPTSARAVYQMEPDAKYATSREILQRLCPDKDQLQRVIEMATQRKVMRSEDPALTTSPPCELPSLAGRTANAAQPMTAVRQHDEVEGEGDEMDKIGTSWLPASWHDPRVRKWKNIFVFFTMLLLLPWGAAFLLS